MEKKQYGRLSTIVDSATAAAVRSPKIEPAPPDLRRRRIAKVNNTTRCATHAVSHKKLHAYIFSTLPPPHENSKYYTQIFIYKILPIASSLPVTYDDVEEPSLVTR